MPLASYSSQYSKIFFGELLYCLSDINECESEPCINGRECIDKVGHYTCLCPSVFDGVNCQTGICEAWGENP